MALGKSNCVAQNQACGWYCIERETYFCLNPSFLCGTKKPIYIYMYMSECIYIYIKLILLSLSDRHPSAANFEFSLEDKHR